MYSKEIVLEHFFSGYDYVMLETNENALLGNVEKMKVDSSVIAVQDKGRILLFQHDGKFITKIDKLGRGAGEYLSVEDFVLKIHWCIYCHVPKGVFWSMIGKLLL